MEIKIFFNKDFVLLYTSVDINECQNATTRCHANATCHNRDGSYFCKCFNGYDGDGKNCTGMYFMPLLSYFDLKFNTEVVQFNAIQPVYCIAQFTLWNNIE